MKEQDRARFRANIRWFNQFFDGIRNIYEIIVTQLPAEFFPNTFIFSSENYYFPRQKVAPSIPAYYALLVEGYRYGLQVLTVIDASLIARNDYFLHEPSIIVVLHSQPHKNSWVDEFAMNVIQNRSLESVHRDDGTIKGRIKSKYQADFIAFQVSLDLFSDCEDPQAAVHQNIVNPLVENLRRGFTTSTKG